MADTTENPPWDLDTDEIASIASDELYQNRPNRWKGAKSSWRHYTEQERLLWRSLKQLNNEDLAKHLYNAFELAKLEPKASEEVKLFFSDDGNC